MASRRSLSFALPLALFASLVVGSLHAAEPSEEQKKVARNAMAEGRELRDEKDFKGALEAFKKAHEIMDVPTTGLEVARTMVQLGQLREARDMAVTVTNIPKEKHEPAPFVTAREDAQKLADELSQRIPKLKITVKGLAKADKVDFSADGTPVVPDAGTGTIELNPGKHTIVAKHGSDQATADVDLRDGEQRDVTLEFKTEKAAPPPATTEAPPPPPPPEATGSPWTRPITLVGFGVAGVGVIAGGVTGLMAMSKASSAKNDCVDNKCPPSTHADIDSGKTMALISNVSFAVAIVGAGVGVYGLVSAPKQENKEGAWVRPYLGIGSAGVAGRF